MNTFSPVLLKKNRQMVNLRRLIFWSMLGIFIACGDDDEVNDLPEKRLITDVTFVLGTSGNNPEVVMTYSDLDGVGGNEPAIIGGTLTPNMIYFGTIELSNDANTPPEDIDEAINSNKEDNQLFYSVSGLDLEINYADVDGDGNPIGLFTALMTGAPGLGTITISIQRGLNKFGAGVSDGAIANAGGTTDLQVTFPVEIQ